MGVHVARVGVFNVDALGNILKKDDASITLKQQLSTSIEHLVVEDAANSNTSGNPTVKQYLELEAGDDYIIAYMDQSTVVTKLSTGGGHLEDNQDVDISSPADNDGLIYDSSSSTWINQPIVASDIDAVANSTVLTNMVAISQADYDSLGSYSSTTLYVITD